MALKTLLLDLQNISGGLLDDAVATVTYDRTVRRKSGGVVPTPAATPVRLSQQQTVDVLASDDPDLTDDSTGFVIVVTVVRSDQDGRRAGDRYTAQVHNTASSPVPLSKCLATVAPLPASLNLDVTMGRLSTVEEVAAAAVAAAQQTKTETAAKVAQIDERSISADAKAQQALEKADAAVAPTDEQVAALAARPGSETRSALDGTYLQKTAVIDPASGNLAQSKMRPQAGYHPLLNGFLAEGYGADPTGVADSSAALQACIDAAAAWRNSNASPGIPAARVYATGSYACASTLTPRSRVTMVGASPDGSRIMSTAAAGFATPTGGTVSAQTTVVAFAMENLSAECANGPVFDIAGGFYDGLSRPRFSNCRFWTLSRTSPVWRHRGTAQMIWGSFPNCFFENRASSAGNRATASVIDVSVDAGNVWNSNTFVNCVVEARYAAAPAITVTCTNGGFLWHNRFENVTGEHCAGGLIWLAGCAEFVIESCPEWDTQASASGGVNAYDGHLFKFVAAPGQQNFSTGEIRRSHRIVAADSAPLAAGVYDIYALVASPSSAPRKGIRIIDCDPSSSVSASIFCNGAVTVEGRTRPFKVVTASYSIQEYDPETIVCNSASAITVNLPPSTTALFGRRITVKNVGAGAVSIPQAVDGSAQTLTQWQKLTVTTDGVNAATGRIWMTI